MKVQSTIRYMRVSASQLTLNGVNKTTCHSLHAFHDFMRQCTLPSLKETRTEVLNVSLLKIHFLYFKNDWQNSLCDSKVDKAIQAAGALDLHYQADISIVLFLLSNYNVTDQAYAVVHTVLRISSLHRIIYS